MKNIFRLKSIWLAILLLLFLSGCEIGNIKTATTIEGRVAKGAVSGAVVTAYKAGTTEKIGTATTDVNGYYELYSDLFYDGVVYIESVGGTYTDELTNTPNKDAGLFSLTALSKVGTNDGYVVNITPYSTISHKKMLNDGEDITSGAVVTKYNKAISDIFVGNSFDITKTTPNLHNDPTDDSLDSADAEEYGFMLKAFVDMTASNEANVDAKIDSIAGAITSVENMTITDAMADEIIASFAKPAVQTEMTSGEIADINKTINDARDIKLPDISGSLATITGEYNTTIATWTPVLAATGGILDRCEISPDITASYGLEFNTTTCVISGKPNKQGADTFAITPVNFKGKGKFFRLSLDINASDQAAFSLDGPVVFEENATNYIQTTVGGSCGVGGTYKFELNDTAVASIVVATGEIDFKAPGSIEVKATLSCAQYNDINATKTITVHEVAPNITNSIVNIRGKLRENISWEVNNTGGSIASCAITPSVGTYGLDFNLTTCEISGIPTSTELRAAGANIQITATGSAGGNSVKTINLKIDKATQKPPVSIGPNQPCTTGERFRLVATGGNSTVVGYGYVSSHPLIAAVDASGWVDCLTNGEANITATRTGDVNHIDSEDNYTVSVGLVPPNINNPQTTTGIYGQTINWEVNNTGGLIESCVISPSDLTTKYGLVFSQTDCNITGVPTATTVGDVSFTIKAVTATRGNSTKNIHIIIDKEEQNPYGFDTNLTLTVGQISPKQLDHIGNTTVASTYTSEDETIAIVNINSGAITNTLKAGNVTIVARNVGDTNFKSIDANYTLTVLATDPNITSPFDIATDYNKTISTNWVPNSSTGGAIETCEILPLFAANSGMEFNTTTCEISGTPLYVDEGGTPYTITAKNKAGAGSDTAVVNITIAKATQAELIIPIAHVTDTLADGWHKQNITGGTGTGNITFTGTIPSVIDVNRTTGNVTYSATIANTEITVLKASDNFYKEISKKYRLTVGDFKPEIGASVATIVALYGEANSTMWQAKNDGGDTTVPYTSLDTLPGGLTISASGVIGGIPTAVQGVSSYTIVAKNDSGNDTFDVQIIVNKGSQNLFRFTDGDRQGNKGTGYTYEVNNTQSDGALTYSSSDISKAEVTDVGVVTIKSDATPGNVTIIAHNVGNTNFDKADTNYTLQVVDVAPDITGALAPLVASFNEVVSYELNNTGGTVTACAVSSGTLPATLTIAPTADGSTCVITGTVSEVKGLFNYTFQAQNSAGDASTKELEITTIKADQTGFTIYGDQEIAKTITDFRQAATGGNTTVPIIYTSSNDTIAQVDATGLIIPHIAGDVNITGTRPGGASPATANYNDINDSYQLTILDTVFPIVDYILSTPGNTTTDANATGNITIVWSEPVRKVDGKNIEIRSKGATGHTKGFSTTLLTINGETNVTLSMGTGHLSYGEEYYVVIEAGGFEDMAGNDNVAHGGDGTWNFTVPTQTGDCAYDCIDNCDNY